MEIRGETKVKWWEKVEELIAKNGRHCVDIEDDINVIDKLTPPATRRADR